MPSESCTVAKARKLGRENGPGSKSARAWVPTDTVVVTGVEPLSDAVDGEKVQGIPVGRPVQVNASLLERFPVGVMVNVNVADLPATTVSEDWETPRVKLPVPPPPLVPPPPPPPPTVAVPLPVRAIVWVPLLELSTTVTVPV